MHWICFKTSLHVYLEEKQTTSFHYEFKTKNYWTDEIDEVVIVGDDFIEERKLWMKKKRLMKVIYMKK